MGRNLTPLGGGDTKKLVDLGEIEGYYIKTLKGQGNERNSCIHTFKHQDGTVSSIWGFAVLDEQIENASIGQYLVVIYEGMGQSKAGKSYHKCMVSVDNDIPAMNAVEVVLSKPSAPVDNTSPFDDIVEGSEPEETESIEDDPPF